MRKTVAIMGTLLIAAVILISGSAVAPWIVSVPSSQYCTNINNIIGAPIGTWASIGQSTPSYELGWVLLDLGLGNEMPYSQDFTVYAGYSGGSKESYDVYVGETDDIEQLQYVGRGDDTSDEIFTTPSQPLNAKWRYIFIEGVTGAFASDPAYGPDLDAVGW